MIRNIYKLSLLYLKKYCYILLILIVSLGVVTAVFQNNVKEDIKKFLRSERIIKKII